MFQIKNFNSIVASMENNIAALSDDLTDFNIGSKNRTLLEACAREIEQFYEMLLEGLTEAIPVAIFKSFSFGKLSAAPSNGYVTFTRDPEFAGDIAIPLGTQISSPGTDLIFVTSKAATLLAASSSVDVLVSCTTTGIVGNLVSGTITQLSNTIQGIASVTNQAMFTSGADAETNAERKLRFQKFVKSLPRAIHTAVEYGAENTALYNADGWITERVVKALAHEPCIEDTPPGDPGYVDLYLWNGINGASTELIAETQKIIRGYIDENGDKVAGWKAAGVVVRVYAVSLHIINVTGSVQIAKTGYAFADVQKTVLATIDRYFASLGIGDVFRLSRLIDLLMAIPGIVDVNITVPADNSVPDWSAICCKGVCTITQQS